jgi:DHA1 family bicyclomycin/chloramphenicol resistance-like MFS transporter
MTVPDRPPRFIFAALVAITFIAPLANHMFIPAMPVVKQSFAIGNELAFATLAVVMIAMAFVTPLYGGFSDQWGRKRLLVTGLTVYTTGALVCLVAPDIWSFLAGRALQGAGAGCGVVLARAIARDVYGMDRIAAVIANLTAAYVLGPLLMPIVGGFLIGSFGWRTLFIMIVAAGLALIAMVVFLLPETHSATAARGGAGAVIRRTLRNYGALLRVPRFTAYALVPGLLSGAFFSLATASSFLARENLGVSTEEYGFWFLLLAAGFMSGNFMSGRIGNRATVTFMTVWGSILFLAIVVGMSIAHAILGLASMLMMMVPGFLLGIAQGMCLPYAQAGAMQVNPSLAGSASGAVVFSQLFCAGMGELTVGLLADGTLAPVIFVMLGFAVGALAAAVVAAKSQPRKTA